MKSEEKRKI